MIYLEGGMLRQDNIFELSDAKKKNKTKQNKKTHTHTTKMYSHISINFVRRILALKLAVCDLQLQSAPLIEGTGGTLRVVSPLASVLNSGSLFQSDIYNLFSPGI